MKTSKIIKKIPKGMSVIEYALILAAVATAIIGMQVCLKRAVCGKWKQSADVFGYGRQYDPLTTH